MELVPTPQGLGYKGNGSGYFSFGPRPLFPPPGSNQASAMVVAHIYDSSSVNGHFFSKVAGTWNWALNVGSGIQQFGIRFAGASPTYAPSSSVVGGLSAYNQKTIVLFGTYDGANQYADLAILGSRDVRHTSSRAYTGNFAQNNDSIAIGALASGSQALNNASILAAALWTRCLTQSEIVSLSENPWQLFRPIQRRIWVEVGGGGATNYTLTADVGAYTLTGESATTSRGVRMTGDVGSYALTGQDATTSRGYSLTGDVGVYSLTGESAGTQAGFRIGADTGAYSLTGQDATLTYSQGTTNYTLTAETGAYSITGYDASLTYTPGAANYTLVCDTGSYSLTGVDARVTAARRLLAGVGSYSLTGQNAGGQYERRLVADAGAYSLTGYDATLTATAPTNYSLVCDVGEYVSDGAGASLSYSGENGNLTRAAPGLTPRIWPGLSIRYEGKPKKRVEQLDEQERERLEEIAEQAVIEAAQEASKKAMKASLQASLKAAEMEVTATAYVRLVEMAAQLKKEQIEEEELAIAIAFI